MWSSASNPHPESLFRRKRASQTVESIAELIALVNPVNGQSAKIEKTGRRGRFVYDASDMSVQVAGDSQQGIYVAPGIDVTGVSGCWVRQHVPGNFNLQWFGPDGGGAGDNYDGIVAANAAAAAAVSGVTGAVVYWPNGVYRSSRIVTQPNRVKWQGSNGRGSLFTPYSGFADDYLIEASNGTSSMFGAIIADMHIDVRGYNMVGAINPKAWQETCGPRRVVIQYDGTTKHGIHITNGYGGAAYLKLKDIEIFSDSSSVDAVGVQVDQISLVGGFVLSVDGATITGTSGNNLPIAIAVENDTALLKGVHIEYCGELVEMRGVGSLSVEGLTGSVNATVDMVVLAATFTGRANLRCVVPNGATGDVVRNDVTGASVPASRGMLSEYSYPDIVTENAAMAWVSFLGADGTIEAAYNVSSVTRTAAGSYTVNFAESFPAGNRVVSVMTNVDTVDGIYCSAIGGGSGTENVRVRRGGAYAGALYDAQRVRVVVFGNRVV